MGDNPCKEMMEVWMLNPLADIGLQALGLRTLAKAFELFPELMEEDAFSALPEGKEHDDRSGRPGWKWGDIDPDDYTVCSEIFRTEMCIMTDARILEDTGRKIGQTLVTATEDGVVKGSVRLHVAPSHTGIGWLEFVLIWIGERG